MKYTGRAICLLIAQLLVQLAESSSAESDLEDPLGEGSSKQQGSWSQWWSYDGISGPDYWNINKQWRLCSLGRKQSPIEVRTERLVYDHLLGPIQLSWLPASATNYDDAILRKAAQTGRTGENRDQEKGGAQAPVRVRLLNSGRGIEAWLELGMGATSSGRSQDLAQQEQLVLSHGPLSYAYKLFKIELHSAAASSSQSAELTLGPEGGPDASWEDSRQDERQRRQQQQPWASSRSSEHLIDGRTFDGELQLHFYNRHLASSAAEAQQLANEDSRPSLFAAIGIFLVLDGSGGVLSHQQPSRQQQAKGPDPVGLNSGGGAAASASASDQLRPTKSAIDFILDNLGALQNEGDSIELQLTRGHIESLIPNKRQYVTYQGSMNRPPCAESVDWILINKALRVDRGKFGALFEKLNTNQENIRPFKALNRRLLRTTINNFHSGSGSRRASADVAAIDEDEEDPMGYGIGGDMDIEQRSKQQARSRKPSSTCYSASGLSNKNCSQHAELDAGTAGTDEIQHKPKLDGKRKGPHGSCSMKPNYAYQLRYGKQF